MIKKFSFPKMRNRQFVFTPKIPYNLVAERGEPSKLAIFSMVRGRGLEPPCPCGHIHLKDACMPFHHPRVFIVSSPRF